MVSLRVLRLEQGLSQRDLAVKAGVTQQTVVHLELGRREPHPGTMRRVAEALGVQPAEVDEFRRAIEEKAAA